ncbi:MAG: aminodeoxychorismate synthase component I [Saprospiraceae bacterium]
MRHTHRLPLRHPAEFKRRLLHWTARHSHGLYLDSNGRPDSDGWECLAAAGVARLLECSAGAAFPALRQWVDTERDWKFGFLGYDLKNEVENLRSAHPDGIGLPDMGFFQPITVVGIRNNCLEVHTLEDDPAKILRQVAETSLSAPAPDSPALHLQARISKQEYLDAVEAIRRHIVEGDIYEMNYCQEFFSDAAETDPLRLFERLNALSRAPFAAFMRWGDRYLLSGSPERFLRKKKDTLLSQPIKGTRRRGATPEEDAAIRAALADSEKDRAENVMIVDLVRNDLARNCRPGSVAVTELFGIYSFPTVHHMISTIQGVLRPDAHPVQALRDAFPMGSMTGAPKVRAMELIEHYERSRRGLYAGAVGYWAPEGDFDFNVVIRSLFYHQTNRYLSYQVGSAIVFDSVGEEEYAECLLKGAALRQAAGKPAG